MEKDGFYLTFSHSVQCDQIRKKIVAFEILQYQAILRTYLVR